MSLTTILNNNLAWIIIGALIIIIVVLFAKRNKKPKEERVDYFKEVNQPLKRVYPEGYDVPENFREARDPRLTKPQNIDYLKELERQNEDLQRTKEKLSRMVNKPDMNKWNPGMQFPKPQPKPLPVTVKTDKPKRKIFPILAVIFVLAIVVGAGVFWYGVKHDSFKSFSGQNCQNNFTCPSVSCPQPNCPACPSCNCPVANLTCPIVNIDCTNNS